MMVKFEMFLDGHMDLLGMEGYYGGEINTRGCGRESGLKCGSRAGAWGKSQRGCSEK